MIRTLTIEQLKEKILSYTDSAFHIPAQDDLMIVEIGPLEEYDRKHIQKALRADLQSLEKTASQMLPDHGSEIILYSAEEQGTQLCEAALKLQDMGYKNLHVLKESKEKWIEEGLWISTSQVAADHLDHGANVPLPGGAVFPRDNPKSTDTHPESTSELPRDPRPELKIRDEQIGPLRKKTG